MIDFDVYCYNYFNNKLNILLSHNQKEILFNTLSTKITNTELTFIDIADNQFNKYLINLPLDVITLFNKVSIFRDFEHSTSIRNKILKSLKPLYSYYKLLEIPNLYDNQLLYSFYNNYADPYYNTALYSNYNTTITLPTCKLLLEELLSTVFSTFLTDLKSNILSQSFNLDISLIIDFATPQALIAQNLILQNIKVDAKTTELISSLLQSDCQLIQDHINQELGKLNKKNIISIIEQNLQQYLVYNLINNIDIVRPITIVDNEKEIQNDLVKFYLHDNNIIVESFQYIASQFKNDPIMFANILTLSHSYLVDLTESTYQYGFDTIRDLINTNNITQIPASNILTIINNKFIYTSIVSNVIESAIHQYLIRYIDMILSSKEIHDIIINNIMYKLSKQTPNAATFYTSIYNYIKLYCVKSIYAKSFKPIADLYLSAIDNYNFNITASQISSIIAKKTNLLYTDKVDQNAKLKNFYMTAVSNTIANSFIDKYRI